MNKILSPQEIQELSFNIVGIGPGHRDYLLPAALAAINSADTLIGGERQLSHFEELKKKAVSLEG